jgi:hypothetical protein
MANFEPQDFVGCNLSDKHFLNDEGFLLSSGVFGARPIFKQFGDYTLDYIFSKSKSSIMLVVYNKDNNLLGIVDYFKHHPPIFRNLQVQKSLEIVSKSSFLEYIMSLDKDLANWMLWNI